MDESRELTLLMYESNSVFGKWAACHAESGGLDDEAFVLDGLTGHGDTPLEAAAALLAMAAKECNRRGVV